jgi:hypothetical protein
MFDSSQPCLTSETVDIPVPTPHAATPAPKRGIRTRFYLGWDWNGPVTRLDSASARRLPRDGRVEISCRGRRCPVLRRHRATGARDLHRLLRSLLGRRFHAGDRVFIEVRSGHRRPERIELLFRRGGCPSPGCARAERSRTG